MQFLVLAVCATRFWCSTNKLNQSVGPTSGVAAGQALQRRGSTGGHRGEICGLHRGTHCEYP